LLAPDIEFETAPAEREWKARLSLVFGIKNQRTILKNREHFGPLVVQRPFYPEGPVCHVYLIHPPGGVVGGDKLSINVELQPGSHTLITTPSAGKFYRSDDLKGSQTQQLKVAKDSLLEWFPQENIFFNACKSEIKTEIKLESNALFCGWEINCLGRPAASEKFMQGSITQKINIYRDDRPVFLERTELHGDSELLYSAAGLKSHVVLATFIATGIDKKTADELQEKWHERTERDFSISLINDVLVCRFLGDCAEFAKQGFTEIWTAVRMKQKKLNPCKPRIWST